MSSKPTVERIPRGSVVDYVFASKGSPAGNRGKVTDWGRYYANMTDAEVDEILAGSEPDDPHEFAPEVVAWQHAPLRLGPLVSRRES